MKTSPAAAATLAALLWALPGRAEPAADLGESGHVRKELAVGESVDVQVFGIDRSTYYEVLCRGERLALLLEADGVLQFIGVGAQVHVVVTGTRANRAELSLRPTEQISAWPMRRLVIRREEGRFALEVEAADWAFVVSAHTVLEGGLEVMCDGVRTVMAPDERLDVDRDGDAALFRVVADAWPGRAVGAPAIAAERGPPDERRPEVHVRRRRPTVGALPPLPFVLTGWGAWEIKPPQPVSP